MFEILALTVVKLIHFS